MLYRCVDFGANYFTRVGVDPLELVLPGLSTMHTNTLTMCIFVLYFFLFLVGGGGRF